MGFVQQVGGWITPNWAGVVIIFGGHCRHVLSQHSRTILGGGGLLLIIALAILIVCCRRAMIRVWTRTTCATGLTYSQNQNKRRTLEEGRGATIQMNTLRGQPAPSFSVVPPPEYDARVLAVDVKFIFNQNQTSMGGRPATGATQDRAEKELVYS